MKQFFILGARLQRACSLKAITTLISIGQSAPAWIVVSGRLLLAENAHNDVITLCRAKLKKVDSSLNAVLTPKTRSEASGRRWPQALITFESVS